MEDNGKQASAKPAYNAKTLLAVLFGTAFIAAFNENIVNVGLIDIMAEFAIDSGTAQWLVTGYMIVTTIVVTVVVFLQKRFTLRQIFFAGTAIMLVGSVADMLAPTFGLLLVFRLIQSVGTGIFIPTMMATVLAIAPRKKLGSYLSIGSCCITFGPAFGPVASGLMVTFFGWRSMFLVPTVAMAVLGVLGFAFVKPIAPAQRVKLDVVSVVLSAIGLTVFVYGLSLVTSDAPMAVACLVAGGLVIFAFARRQERVEHPLMNLAPLKKPTFSIACLLVVVAMMTTFSMSVLLPLFFQGAAVMTALMSGVLVLIPILFNAATALFAGRIMDKRGEWPLLPGGFLLVAAGMVAIYLVAPSISLLAMVVAACVVYAGVGFVMSPSQTADLKTLAPELHGFGVGIMSTFIQLAAAIGPSLFVGVYSTSVGENAAAGLPEANATALGFDAAVLVAAVIAVVGLAVSFFYARTAAKRATASAVVAASAPSTASAADVSVNYPELTLERIMKRDAYTVRAHEPVYRVVEKMLAHETSGLPVVDEVGAVVGFVSDGDIMKSLANAEPSFSDLNYSLAVVADDEQFDERLDNLMESDVLDIATRNVVSIPANASIGEVCTILGQSRIKKAPVLDHGKLVGTVSRNDVNRILMQSYLEHKPEN